MNKFEELCQTASDTNVDIIDYPFTSKRIKGLYCDGTIALSKDMYIETEKACVLAEELGHHYTTVGDIIDKKESENRKQELNSVHIAETTYSTFIPSKMVFLVMI